MDDFIPGEKRPLASGVEQSERSAVGRPVTTRISAATEKMALAN